MLALLLAALPSVRSAPSALPVAARAVSERSIDINQVFSGGDLTFYNTYNGYGACGTQLSDDVPSVAMAFGMYDNFPGATANPNDNPICKESVTVTYNGFTKTFPVKDLCAGCDIFTSIDFTPSAFAELGLDESVGRYHGISWVFAGADVGSGSGSGSGSGGDTTSSSSTPQATPTTTSTPEAVPTTTSTHKAVLPTHTGGAAGAGQGSIPSSSSSSPPVLESTSSEPKASKSRTSSSVAPTSSSSSSTGSGSSSSGGSGSSSSGGSGSSSGSETGAFVKCASATTWYLCASDSDCTFMGPVAPGTTCDDKTNSMEAIVAKRMMRHRKRNTQH